MRQDAQTASQAQAQGGQTTQNWAGDPMYAPQPQHVCPNCGYCPCCGRKTLAPYNPYPYPTGPIWLYQPTVTSGGMNVQTGVAGLQGWN